MKKLFVRAITAALFLFSLGAGQKANAQDTTYVFLRGVDTVSVEFHPDLSSQQAEHKPSEAWSLRNNLFYDASGTPNLGVEVPVSGHWTLGGNLGFKPWDRFLRNDPDKQHPQRWRNLVVAPEARFYTDTINTGFFLTGNLLYTHYNTGNVKFPLGMYKRTHDQYVQGNLFGLGLGLGYLWWLSDHWRLEAEVGLAGGWRIDDTYYINEHCDNCFIEHSNAPALVPKLGLNIAYTFGEREKRPDPVERTVRMAPYDTVRPIFLAPLLPLVEEWKGVAGQLEKDNPVLKPSKEYKPYTPDMVLRKMEGPLYVHFELDKTVLKRDFRDNAPILDQIVDITRQIMADTTSSVSCIQIIGLASIEGGEKHNQQLSDGRAKALQKYIQNRLPIPDKLFEANAGGEAWSEFRDQVNDLRLANGEGSALSMAQINNVLDIIDNEADLAAREKRIRNLDGGSVYKVLKDELLSDQRNSGYIRIYYDYVPDETALTINEAIAHIKAHRYEDALRLLEKVKDDERAWSAYGVALFYNGRTNEALSVLRKAAAAGDETAARNLQDMEHVVEHNAHVGEKIYTRDIYGNEITNNK
ncbi:MAG: DUF3575 domain-containing protein [Bacteroidales bacterium]|nr:DUF3575 domain-containing protein [Bacteroidales bacterium]